MILEYARTLIECAPVGIRTFDESGQCISANGAAARITGSSIEELLSQNYMNIATWKNSGLIDAARRTIATGQGHRLIRRFAVRPGLRALLDNQFERFIVGGHRYLLQVVIDNPPNERPSDGVFAGIEGA